jgi:hypothetical protein
MILLIDKTLFLLSKTAPQKKSAAIILFGDKLDYFIGEYVPTNFGMRACFMGPSLK